MGDASVIPCLDDRARREAVAAVEEDLRTLERLLAEGRFETGPARIGAEQEIFLVKDGRAAPVAVELLASLSDPRFTHEVGRINLECNLTPRELGGSCLRDLEVELHALLGQARRGARRFGADVVLAGILPSLRPEDVTREALVETQRFLALDEATRAAHVDEGGIRIAGADTFEVAHGSMVLDACATSFQVHLQVSPEAFTDAYNVAQLVAAPLLACAGNSAILAGKRLWHETRLPLLEQSADFRSPEQVARGEPGRTGLGADWLRGTIVDLFREDLARWPPLLRPAAPDPRRLSALQVFNGTVWRWNRACFGVGNGHPHLRIECRVLPAGPTVVDEMANAAFWIGLMIAGPRLGDVTTLPFFAVAENLARAARDGLAARLTWLDGHTYAARDLLLQELIPLARTGLANAGVDEDDARRAMDIVEARTARGRTGARFQLDAWDRAPEGEEPGLFVARELERHFRTGRPVHTWPAEQGPHAPTHPGDAHPRG